MLMATAALSSKRTRRETSSSYTPPPAGYDVATRAAAMPGSWSLPNPPNTSSSVTVGNRTQLQAQVSGGAKIITMDPEGDWDLESEIQLTAADIHLIATGCHITGDIGRHLLINNSRIKVTGGLWDGYYQIDSSSSRTDVHIYDGNYGDGYSGAGSFQLYGNYNRVLVEKTLHYTRGNGVCMYSEGGATGGCTNAIYANSAFVNTGGTQSNLRLHGGTHLIMDCYSQNTPTGGSVFRGHSHGPASDRPVQRFVAARNLTLGGRIQFYGGSDTNTQVEDLHLIDNEVHSYHGGYYMRSLDIITAAFTGNRFYDDGSLPPWSTGVGGWTYDDNEMAGYAAITMADWNSTGQPQA